MQAYTVHQDQQKDDDQLSRRRAIDDKNHLFKAEFSSMGWADQQ